MKKLLMELITAALADYDGYFGLADPNSAYPMTVFSFPSDSAGNAEAASFGGDTETFRVQIAVFDDQADGMRLIQQMDTINDDVVALRSEDGVVRVKYAGGSGPSYLDTDREWRCTADYLITMAPITTSS